MADLLSRRILVAATMVGGLLVFVQCTASVSTGTLPQGSTGDGGSSTPGPSSATAASKTVGVNGGILASTDGAVQISIPPGALDRDVVVTVETVTSPAAGSVGKVFEIGPTGTQFKSPVAIALKYTSSDLGTHEPSDLRVATTDASLWKPLEGYSLSEATGTVTGTTTHLSPYALVFVASEAAQVCAPGGVHVSCTNAGPGGGGGTQCGQPTCESRGAYDPCPSYPGAITVGCTNVASGYDTQCCFPAGAEVCFKTGLANGCASGVSCEHPTCPAAPCGQYAGATAKSCTNEAYGWSAVCCLPPGSAVPTDGSKGGGTSADAGAPAADGGSGGPDPGGTPDAGGTTGETDAGAPDPGAPECSPAGPCLEDETLESILCPDGATPPAYCHLSGRPPPQGSAFYCCDAVK